jgi:hypothetical protein
MEQSHDPPLAKLGRFSWEMLTEMLHQWTISPYLAGLDADHRSHTDSHAGEREGDSTVQQPNFALFATSRDATIAWKY